MAKSKKALVHFFWEEDSITTSGSNVSFEAKIKVACGAKSGEADNRKRYVTCPKCRKALKNKKIRPKQRRNPVKFLKTYQEQLARLVERAVSKVKKIQLKRSKQKKAELKRKRRAKKKSKVLKLKRRKKVAKKKTGRRRKRVAG